MQRPEKRWKVSSLRTTLGVRQDQIAELNGELNAHPPFYAEVYRQRMEEFQEAAELNLQNVERVKGSVLS